MYEHEMRAALEEARDKLTKQDALLRRLTATPLLYATVIGQGGEQSVPTELKRGMQVRLHDNGQVGKIQRVDAGDALIEVGGNSNWYYFSQFEVLPQERSFALVIIDGKLTEVEAAPDLKFSAGDTVKVSAETMQIVGVADFTHLGEVATVTQPLDAVQAEVELDGTARIVLTGQSGQVERGDRVILDSSGRLILRNLGKNDEQFLFTGTTNVSWEDIGGLLDAKQAFFEAIEQPFLHPELYRFYNKKPVKGILLYGPPGCGKTMLGKAAATSIAKSHGQDGSAGFFYVKAPEILNKYVGESEARIRRLFEQARNHEKQFGYPAVVFIDEADAIMGKRGSGISSDIERTIVPMFLTEMDGLEASGALVILSTNRPDVLDPAIVRDGRIDRKIKVTRPDPTMATEIFQLNLRNVPLSNGYTTQELAQRATDVLFAPDRVLYNIQLRGGASLDMTFAELVNGAMIAGIVDKATTIAMNRDIAEGKRSGMKADDLAQAVADTFRENYDLDHKDEIADFVDAFRADVTNVQRAVSTAA